MLALMQPHNQAEFPLLTNFTVSLASSLHIHLPQPLYSELLHDQTVFCLRSFLYITSVLY